MYYAQFHELLRVENKMPNKKKRTIENPQPSPILNQDVVNLIAKYVSYTKGLKAFRQTSKFNNYWVENTDAGQLARMASNLEPSQINKLVASFCKNKNQMIKIGNWYLPISVMVSVFCKSDFSKGINVLNVGTCVAAGVAGFLGSILIIGFSFKKTTKGFFEEVADAITLPTILGIFIALFSKNVGVAASIFCVALKAIFGFPGGVPMLDVSPVPTPQQLEMGIKDGEHLGRFEAVNSVMDGITNAAVNVSVITSLAASIVRFGILANNNKVETARAKQEEIRKPLSQPNYCAVRLFQKKTNPTVIEWRSKCTVPLIQDNLSL